jgi:hypothetical protein
MEFLQDRSCQKAASALLKHTKVKGFCTNHRMDSTLKNAENISAHKIKVQELKGTGCKPRTCRDE